ncbi:MAG: TatD family hydrolase [Halobacteriovoraceae bacterium]|nr:TatD family hydrolase [Halobacteriovoraceae bacterium]
MFIDFHTHKVQDSTADLSLYSHYDLQTPPPKEIDYNNLKICIGLHPWYLPDTIQEGLLQLEKWDSLIPTFGFGECGLDRLKGPDLTIQIKFLEAQLKWAEEKEKPFVVFHCVRAFPEIIKTLNKNIFSGKIVFHDFRANPELTQELLKRPKVFFSLGSLLFLNQYSEKQTQMINLIPLEKLFLETDDSDQQIKLAYSRYCEITNTNLSDLTTQVKKNFDSLNP